MRKHLLAIGLLLLLGAGHDLLACGDKFLVVGRGTRFQRGAVPRDSAKILVYANPASALPKALEKAKVDSTLRKAGYRPSSVADPKGLQQALEEGGWALIVTDLSDGNFLRGQLRGKNSAAMIVPVLHNPTGTEIALAKKEYQHVIKGPLKSQAFLGAIDDAMALREKLVRTKSAA